MAIYTNIRNEFESLQYIKTNFNPITEKVLQLISYFDSFDYPIKFDEIISILNFKEWKIRNALIELRYQDYISQKYDYYFIPGKEWTIEKRINSKKLFRQNLKKLIKIGWILSHIPFVKGLILTGSVSKEIFEKNDDFDFLVIAKPNYVWLCRLIIEKIRKLSFENFKIKNFQYFDCNYFISEENLTIEDQNEFTAIEIFFAKPIFNYNNYQKFIDKNKWIKNYFRLPKSNPSISLVKRRIQPIQTILEKLIKLFLVIFYRKNSIERELYYRYYIQSLKRNSVSCLDEYREKKSLTQIKNSNNTQPFMIKLFREYKTNKSRNKVKTKYIRKLLTQPGNNSITDFANL